MRLIRFLPKSMRVHSLKKKVVELNAGMREFGGVTALSWAKEGTGSPEEVRTKYEAMSDDEVSGIRSWYQEGLEMWVREGHPIDPEEDPVSAALLLNLRVAGEVLQERGASPARGSEDSTSG